MSTYALITGTLFRQAEERTSSKTGRTFVSATVKCGETGDAEFWSITAFSQSAQSELLRLGAGDALSAQGKLEIKTYVANDGATKISRSIVADSVLALRAPPREKKPKAPKPAPTHEQPATTTTDPDLDDSIPF